VSTAVSIGGDGMIGSTPAALLGAFAADEQTEAVVYVGEPGTNLEHDLADAIERLGVGKPIVALVVGRFVEEFPKGAVFGHAGAVIAGVRGRPSEKVRRLAEAGALTAESLEQAIGLVREAVANGVGA
jgi:succinyl-CoA synthetase alpha subunit